MPQNVFLQVCVSLVWLARLRCLVFIFPNISACAGLLVSGCWFSGHVLNSNDFRSGWGYFLYPRLSFDMPGASTLAPWGTILAPCEHPGGPWEQQGGHMTVLKQILIDCGAILGSHVQSFLGNEDYKSCFSGLLPDFFLSDL